VHCVPTGGATAGLKLSVSASATVCTNPLVQLMSNSNVVPGAYPPSLPAPVTTLVRLKLPVSCWIRFVTVTATGVVTLVTTTF